MAYFFQEAQINKVMALIPEEHEENREHARGAELAAHILSGVTLDKIVLENDILYICRDACTSSFTSYTERECVKIENELKDEIRDLFGVDAEVSFMQTGSYNQEPDPIPPMYWGGTETVYVYSLSIKVRL